MVAQLLKDSLVTILLYELPLLLPGTRLRAPLLRPGSRFPFSTNGQRRFVRGRGCRPLDCRRDDGACCNIRVLRNTGQFPGDILWIENKIDAAGGHRAMRHRIVFCRVILREGNAPLGFDRFQSQRAVSRGAGKNNTDGPLALVLRQRFEKGIDGMVRSTILRARLQFQNALRDAQLRVGGNDINMIRFYSQVVRNLPHRNRSGLRQKLRQSAFVLGIQMLHEHEAETCVERQMLQQLSEGFQSSCRGADADNGERPGRMVGFFG